jgi:hypothetical protein
MLTVTSNKYTPACNANSGGVSRAWIFDPADFTWTQAAATAANPLPPYTAVALVSGATLAGGSGFYPIPFYYLTASYKATHTRKNTANKWTHTFSCMLPQMSSGLTEYIANIQSASTCSSIGLLIEDYNGIFTVIGEGVVNGTAIAQLWRMLMDGTEEDTGKNIDDDNAVTLVIKGDYNRKAVQYTGTLDSIVALQETV